MIVQSISIFTADLAWWLLVLVMLIRPVNDIFANRFTRLLCRYRKYIGIGSGLMALLHVILYFVYSQAGWDFWSGYGWDLGSLFGWGVLAFLFIIPPLITSNSLSQRVLKKYWKIVQYFSYLAFVCTAIHISFLDDWWWTSVFAAGLWLVFWFLAWFKKKNYKIKSSC